MSRGIPSCFEVQAVIPILSGDDLLMVLKHCQ